MTKPKKVDVLITVTVSFGDIKGYVSVTMPMMSDEIIRHNDDRYNGNFEGLKAATARYINSHIKDA